MMKDGMRNEDQNEKVEKIMYYYLDLCSDRDDNN